ncbi:EcsC family protein [Marihabitans asiaticum]|uniref:EcsC family protein n=1 Tax=Marihabitans asiaticum TaxID=415218 RepID=A0A560WA04_9MICO|nr:EcsC family protein [Marihabitans asiaticum]TWD14458.1 EcsC family protein [Marihabitans asiaticum]
MGFISDTLGFGKEQKKQVQQTRTALEQAREPQDQGALSSSVSKLVENLLDTGIDGKGPFDSATKVADAARAKHGGDVEKAVDEVVGDHLKLVAASGFVTNLGGFITLPVALPANVLGFYLLATRMAAGVARLRGYDITDPHIRSAVLLSLVGADNQDLLAKAGMVAPTGRLTSLAAQKLPGPALMVVNKAVGFRILSTAGKKTFSRFGRSIPLVGGAVGAGLDGWLMKQLGDHVRTEFPPQGGAPGA